MDYNAGSLHFLTVLPLPDKRKDSLPGKEKAVMLVIRMKAEKYIDNRVHSFYNRVAYSKRL